MHEAGIIDSVLVIASNTAKENGAERIETIRMRIGVLTGVVEEALQHAFEVLKQDTPARDATLVVEYVQGRSWCRTCGTGFVTDDLLILCPSCGNPGDRILGGLETELVTIDVC